MKEMIVYIIGFASGLIFYAKLLDKPEVKINKVKSRRGFLGISFRKKKT